MERARICVLGSANMDLVVFADRAPAMGETVTGDRFLTIPGGKGANQAVACARAGGADTQMLLALGDDPQAAPLETSLRDAGVALHIVRTPQVQTGTAFVSLGDDAENAIIVVPGANMQLRPEDLPELDDVDALLLQLETPLPTVEAWARSARAAGVTVALNAAPMPAQHLPASLLAAIDLLIVNEGELAALVPGAGTVAERVAALDVPGVIVTLGPRGCYARIRGATLLQPGFRVEALDTTGAGDTFCGTLVAGIASGLAPERALRRACAASALACTRYGAQASVPTRGEVDVLLASDEDHAAHAREALAAYCGLAAH
jgi:ribokinase